MFCHDKLTVYKKAVEFLGAAHSILRGLSPGNGDVNNQLRRAAMSIALNIAEGAGKTGTKDKRRFYSIARGSALECAALLDLCTEWHLVDQSLIIEARTILEQIAAMLGKLCANSYQGTGSGAVPVPGSG